MRHVLTYTQKNMHIHVPCAIICLTIGAYLAVVCLVPSFIPECHEIITHGVISTLIPYLLFVLIGAPLFTLWYYYMQSKSDRKRVYNRHHLV